MMGASTGSREPSPAVSALSGFDPARERRAAYDKGRRAARIGRSESTNPYPPESDLSARWMSGFASVGTSLPNEPDDVAWRIEATRASAEYARRVNALLERLAA